MATASDKGSLLNNLVVTRTFIAFVILDWIQLDPKRISPLMVVCTGVVVILLVARRQTRTPTIELVRDDVIL
jgi:hypothetical protein